MRILLITAYLTLMLSASLRADVPRLNFTAACQAASVDHATLEICIKDEEKARAELGKQWSKYSGDDASHCAQLASMGDIQSYVELLTCLEMRSEARRLPKDITEK